jgi:hypothetical protein
MQPTEIGQIDSRPIGTTSLPTRAYSPGQVAGAAFIGSPIASSMLLASNFVLFGAPDRKWRVIIGCSLATIAIFVLALFLPEDFPGGAIPAAYTAALLQFARSTQATDFEAYIASGGVKHSNWRVFGIGVLWMFAVLALFFVVLFFLPEEWFPEVAP